MNRVQHASVGIMIVGIFSADTIGQWVEQSIPLEAGWNAVFLEVDPAPESATDIFSSLPIASVWTRVPMQVRQLGNDCTGPNDPDCLGTTDTQWRVWLPLSAAAGPVVNLRVIRGGRVYFIEATQPTTLTVVGRPNGSETRYQKGLNPVGFYVSPSDPPTFDEYLAPSTSLANAVVYSTTASGEVTAVSRDSAISPARGYWVSAEQTLTYAGPVQIDTLSLRGIEFGKRGTSQRTAIRNTAGPQSDLSVALQASAVVPVTSPAQPSNAGDLPLFWRDYGSGTQAQDMLQWRAVGELSNPPTALDVGVRRTGLPAANVDQEFQGAQYQGVLRVESALGYRRFLGVTAEVLSSLGNSGAAAAEGGGTGPRPGLYVGRIKVDKVAWVAAGARAWANDSAEDPEFASVMQCDGGANDGGACFPDRRRCVGSPEIELMSVACEDDNDCPPEATCATLTDCMGGTCRGFCVGGGSPNEPCDDSLSCGDQGVCSATVNTSDLRPVAFPFEFKVLIHLDEFGQHKMLTEVAFLATDGNAVVLATPDCDPAFCDGLDGALYVNGQPQAQRISTPAFALDDDLLMSGAFTSMLNGVIVLPADHSLNPFKHQFHPDSDCDQAGECYDITRAVVFNFEPDPPEGISELEWGDAVLGGVYTEQVSGLHRETITAQGRFRLKRISQIGLLNTPVGGGKPQ